MGRRERDGRGWGRSGQQRPKLSELQGQRKQRQRSRKERRRAEEGLTQRCTSQDRGGSEKQIYIYIYTRARAHTHTDGGRKMQGCAQKERWGFRSTLRV